jgi:hypothetical protein
LKTVLYSPAGKVIRKLTLNSNAAEFEIDLTGQAPGRYVLSAAAYDKEGRQLAVDDKPVFVCKKKKREFVQKQEVTLKRENIYINGRLFFPFMLSSVYDPKVPQCFNIQYAALLRAPSGIPHSISRKPFLYYRYYGDEVTREKIRKAFDEISEEKVLYRTLQYEAQIPLYQESEKGPLPVKTSEVYRSLNKYIKEIRPQALTGIQVDKKSAVEEFADCADILEYAGWSSSYSRDPIYNSERDIKYVRQFVKGKPLIWWIGASIPSPSARTAENLRCATYLALLNGVNGIIYHNGHRGVPLTRTRLWSVFEQLSSEVEFIYPVITSGRKPAGIKTETADLKLVSRSYKGSLYITALNTTPETIEGIIEIPADIAGAEVLFENRSLAVKQGVLKDRFTPYEPHVYRLR